MKAAFGEALRAYYLPEPPLLFGDGKQHLDPKHGITMFGPRSLRDTKRHPAQIIVGVIGTAESVRRAIQWVESRAQGVPGDKDHTEFPGCTSTKGYRTTIATDSRWVAQLTRSEIDDALAPQRRREKFENCLKLIEQKIRRLREMDQPPQYILIALPKDIEDACWSIDFSERGAGQIHRDFRRALKAHAMPHGIPTQILREETISDDPGDHPAKIAWNFFTGMYFKAGGLPWTPLELAEGSCYIGISFFRPLGSKSTLCTSLAQAFNETGDGFILRGPDFEWDISRQESRSPHLTEDVAKHIVNLVVDKYDELLGSPPKRVVVHKRSRFWEKERSGFLAGLRERRCRYDLVALERQTEVRLFPENAYPTLRGTAFRVGSLDYLYTSGFVAFLKHYPALHLPTPLRLADHVGYDTSREDLLREILVLTKLNWNAARLGGHMPITLKFAELVGDILREIPPERTPLPQFKFYM